MINSRDIEVLADPVKLRVKLFISSCADQGIDLLVTSTYRDVESQNALYAQGRTMQGPIVTNAKGGQSFHQYKCAVDVVPIVNGKCVWDTSLPIWTTVAKLGKEAGLDWAGDWVHFKEMAHFQYTGGLSLQDLQNGATVQVGA